MIKILIHHEILESFRYNEVIRDLMNLIQSNQVIELLVPTHFKFILSNEAVNTLMRIASIPGVRQQKVGTEYLGNSKKDEEAFISKFNYVDIIPNDSTLFFYSDKEVKGEYYTSLKDYIVKKNLSNKFNILRLITFSISAVSALALVLIVSEVTPFMIAFGLFGAVAFYLAMNKIRYKLLLK